MASYFVTGTDTEIGKTFVTSQLLRTGADAGLSTLGYKPVSAGCELIDGVYSNEDARAIKAASSVSAPLEQINPIALLPPIAPHIAAQQAGVTITEDAIVQGYQQLQTYQPDLLLMEGAGGWKLPLAENLWMPEVVKALSLEVILVVGMRLGCLNHALLTADAILRDGLKLKGWVANQLDPAMPVYTENLQTLKNSMPAPLLAELPFNPSKESLQGLSSLVQKLA
ncbi:dethiobiotin synthase [Alteromonas sp. C1M14]|uniref:dethiobiotin synthase n=1 Tax=Alteromonas sp. C1M14 TaxID=2841567 RepID=UPI001C09AB33|nr:dethiobiotin synthase [Alteromonas sp. C1M14]MBU2977452.1 dethiobiotin synthase [Alteromonas sp. C1M14]